MDPVYPLVVSAMIEVTNTSLSGADAANAAVRCRSNNGAERSRFSALLILFCKNVWNWAVASSPKPFIALVIAIRQDNNVQSSVASADSSIGTIDLSGGERAHNAAANPALTRSLVSHVGHLQKASLGFWCRGRETWAVALEYGCMVRCDIRCDRTKLPGGGGSFESIEQRGKLGAEFYQFRCIEAVLSMTNRMSMACSVGTRKTLPRSSHPRRFGQGRRD